MNNLDRELDVALASLRDEALPESALASVRVGVRSRIEDGRRRRVWTVWLSLAAAAALVWMTVSIPWSLATLPLKTARAPEVASIALERPVLKPARGHSKLRPVPAPIEQVRTTLGDPLPAPPREEQTQFMRIITDDPNVVILWAMDFKGETR